MPTNERQDLTLRRAEEARTLLFMPAYNEAATVATVVSEAQHAAPDATVLVIDDGSTDETVANARRAGALVASLPFNMGSGSAQQTGYAYALRHGFEYFAHLDADGQHPPFQIRRLLDAVWDGECDLVIGTRFAPNDDPSVANFRPGRIRRIGIVLFSHLLWGTTGRRFTDVTSGYRAGNRRVIELFEGRYQPDYAEIEALQRALHEGLKVIEIPVLMHPRQEGSSYITPVRSAYYVFKTILTLAVGRFRTRT